LDCGFNLSQIVDAGSGLRSGAGVQEAGNANCRQDAYDGYDNHNFHQREARQERSFGGFHTIFSFVYAA
jgi:hypothetical protein